MIRTPLIRLRSADQVGRIFLKLEILQPTGSFKIRAAANAILALSSDQLAHGVVTTSTGNFGRALATVASRLDVPCTAVVPDTSSEAKGEALRRAGATANVVPFNDWWEMLETKSTHGLPGAFISPVAGKHVMEGNGTMALEILEDLPEVDTVLVPVGGGGLVSGIAGVFRQRRPATRIVACETDTSLPFRAALTSGHPTMIDHTPSFVDGIGGRTVMNEMWPVVRQAVDACVDVTLDQVASTIRLLASEHHLIVEGAGAVPVAAALADRNRAETVVCIVSGGNLGLQKLATILNGQIPSLA